MSIFNKNIVYFDLELHVDLIKLLIERRLSEFDNYKLMQNKQLSIGSMEDSFEKIIISLGLLAYLQPNFLWQKFVGNNSQNNLWLTGGVVVNEKFYPTIQTCFFLLELIEPVSINEKVNLLQLLKPGKRFYKLIDLNQEEDNQILITGFTLKKQIIEKLVYSRDYAPEYDIKFPAFKIDTQMTWDDLVLPYQSYESIEEIVNWAIYRDRMFAEFKVSRKIKKGYRALFYGPSGTGKTLTASLIGKKINREVYRIDLSRITSKYVGETEKNLEKVFSFAEDKDWILFFDEAEALFGKRTSTKSSNDKYANQQIAYLLQRIEDYPGIVILASNKKGEIDTAFMRRFQLFLEFKIPDSDQRLELWDKALSEDFVLGKDVDLREIAEKYTLTGGTLVNILRNLSVHALKNNSNEIKQKVITNLISKEFEKMGKTVNA